MPEFLSQYLPEFLKNETLLSQGAALFQVVFIDLVMAGDNAVAVGLAAAGLAPENRRKAILYGLIAAVILRVAFVFMTTFLLGLVGLLFAGGLLLLWVAWKMWRELHEHHAEGPAAGAADGSAPVAKKKTLGAAVLQILIADLSMSLDNVLAVAGAARDHREVLFIGLALAIALMGVASHFIAKLLHKYRWIGFIGVAVILWVAGNMVWEGHRDIVVDTDHVKQYNEVVPDFMDITQTDIDHFKPKAPAKH